MGAQRPYSWFTHFSKFGIYPVVITRHWNNEVKTLADASLPDNSPINIEKHDWGEIHYLPFRGSLRDRFLQKYGNSWGPIRKLLTVWELFAQNLAFAFNPYQSFFHYASSLVQSGITFHAAIISANPFSLFAIGYQLQKKLGIRWIADYRDDWTTNAFKETRGVVLKTLSKLEHRNEKKWVNSAAFFTSVTSLYVKKIGAVTHKNGHVVLNGFEEVEHAELPKLNNHIRMLYAGSVYPGQNFSLLHEGIHFFKNTSADITFSIVFAGAMVEGAVPDNIQSFINKVNPDFVKVEVLPRLSQKEFEAIKETSHILFTAPYGNHKGIVSAKLFHYISWGKPVLLAGTDHDVMEELVSPYSLGYVCENSAELSAALRSVVEKYSSDNMAPTLEDMQYINTFRRENQAKVLAELIHNNIPTCAE